MLFMDRLPGDTERLGDLRERPTGSQGTSNGGLLDAIGETAQRAYGRQSVGGIFRKGRLSDVHTSTLVDAPMDVNLS